MGTFFDQVAPGVWIAGFPLRRMGAEMRRNVTVLLLSDGRTVIHSTAPFSDEHIAAIRSLGQPGWIVEGSIRHDTYAAEGRAAFPELPYLAPTGFSKELEFPTGELLPAPGEWDGELDVLHIEGASSMGEYVFFHRGSRTLVVCDLLFNFALHEPLWTELLIRAASIGDAHTPGMSRLFKMSVDDLRAFGASMRRVLELNFDRVIVGHGDVIASGGKEALRTALREADLPQE
ncbi:MAG: hypothetical protein SFU53_11340 [Terrimicrobiaceae bacterium]|nr:hypothetical protein [Terrimicrobiaceae bacterium]